MNRKEKRQQMVQRQQELLNAARAAHRELSAEEQAEFDSLQRQIETLNVEIEQEERQQGAGQGAETPAEGAGQETAKSDRGRFCGTRPGVVLCFGGVSLV